MRALDPSGRTHGKIHSCLVGITQSSVDLEVVVTFLLRHSRQDSSFFDEDIHLPQEFLPVDAESDEAFVQISLEDRRDFRED